MSKSMTYGGVELNRVSIAVAIATAMLLVAGLVYFLGVRNTFAVAPSDFGLKEGDVVSAAGSDDPDVYIVNDLGFKRLFLNPAIFGFYGHLGGFAAVKNISPATRDAFGTSGLFRNCETNDEKVYGVETTGEDTGMLHWVNTSGAQAVADDPNFFKKVFCINSNEFNWYSKGSDYTSVNQVPNYTRVPGVTPTATPVPVGPLSVSLAPGNPAAQTITRNATGVEYLRFRVNGTGTLNTVVIKRLGAGVVADFGNVYLYDGAKRLTSGKSFSSATGELTFLLNTSVGGAKDLSIIADMATATAGDVNYVQLVSVTAAGGATVSGTPINGNNFAVSGATGGRLDVAKSGSLSDPTVGQKQALLTEFKLTANTEGATVKRLTMINGGTLKPADLTNLKLKVEAAGKEWVGTSTTDGYVVFDLDSGYFIAKGSNAIFKMYGDLSGKKDETVDLYFENAADLFALGDQFGQGMNTASGTAAQGITDLDSAAEATTLTLQGGALTLVFNGPTATTIGTTVSDATFLRYSITAASNIELKKHELTLCVDTTGNGTFDNAADEAEWDELNDIKVWDEDTNTVVIGPKDGTASDTNDTASCPDAATGSQKSFTDTVDLVAGKTYNYKVTADVDTSLGGTLTQSGSIIRIVLDDYSDDAGDVTVAKYAGTNTAVAAADIIPRADIAGPNITLSASSLTLSLAGNPGDQTKIRGTKDVNAVGVTFAAGQASALKVTTIKITGYANDNGSSETTFDEGVSPDEDTGVSVANAMAKVQLYEAETGTLIAGSDKVTSNLLGTSGTGTMTFSNLNWNIPAGTSKTVLVKVDLSNNTASGTGGDDYAFDIGGTADVTALDSDSRTVNAGNQKVNGTVAAPTQVLTVKNSGSITLAQAADSPRKGAIYWGQTNAPVSKFRLSATDEGQYIEKLTIAASNSTENTHAKNNVKNVLLTYMTKGGTSPITVTQAFGNTASVNFAWAAGDPNRPYVAQDSSMDLSVNADLKLKAEGATQTAATDVFFSLDLVDSFNGSTANGFRAVGDGSGTVLDGASTGIADVLGTNDQYVYRVFPEIAKVDLAAPFDFIGTPTVFKFTVTARGLAGSTLRFDNEAVSSGSIKFGVVSSGEYTANGTSTSFSVYDEDNVLIDSGNLTKDALASSPNVASLTFDFSSRDVEIAAGGTKTFRIEITNPNTNYSKTKDTGRAADFFQVVLKDNEAGLINWVGDYANTTAALDTASTTGTLKSLPLFGPTFQR